MHEISHLLCFKESNDSLLVEKHENIILLSDCKFKIFNIKLNEFQCFNNWKSLVEQGQKEKSVKNFKVQNWHWKIDWILNELSDSDTKLEGTEHH